MEKGTLVAVENCSTQGIKLKCDAKVLCHRVESTTTVTRAPNLLVGDMQVNKSVSDVKKKKKKR